MSSELSDPLTTSKLARSSAAGSGSGSGSGAGAAGLGSAANADLLRSIPKHLRATAPSLLPVGVTERGQLTSLPAYVERYKQALATHERTQKEKRNVKKQQRENMVLELNMNRKFKLVRDEKWSELQLHLKREEKQRDKARARRLGLSLEDAVQQRLAATTTEIDANVPETVAKSLRDQQKSMCCLPPPSLFGRSMLVSCLAYPV
jgi:hypothetical protein